MKRLFTSVFLLMASIAASQEIDPWKIYDKLNPDIYMDKSPISSVAITPYYNSNTQLVEGRIWWTGIVENASGWTGTLISIVGVNASFESFVDIYKDLGGTNQFDLSSTNLRKILSLQLIETPESDVLKILEEMIKDQEAEKEPMPQPAGGVYDSPEAGSRPVRRDDMRVGR